MIPHPYMIINKLPCNIQKTVDYGAITKFWFIYWFENVKFKCKLNNPC